MGLFFIFFFFPFIIDLFFRLFETKSSTPLVIEEIVEEPVSKNIQSESKMQVKKEHLLPVEDRIITEKLKYDVLCGICCMILTHPRQCLSGHVYCGDCLAKCIGKGMPCPVCRRDMTEESVARNLFLEEYCKEFLVHCQYYYECPETENPILVIADDGCPEEIQYCDLESHEKECKYSWIRCPFTYRSNSEHKVRKLNWQAHKEVCEFRPTICRYCDNCQPFMELNVCRFIY